jgi:outer membrane protein assembly complex protein YaeT
MKFLKKLLKVLCVTVVAIAVLLVAGAVYVQKGLGSFLQNFAKEKYGWVLKISAAELHFHPLSVRLESIELSAPAKGTFFQANTVSADLPYSSFWEDEFVVSDVKLESPRLDLNRLPELIPSAKTSSGKAPAFRVERLTVSSAALVVEKYEFHDIFVEARVDQTAVELQKLDARFGNMEMSAQGSIQFPDTPRLSLTYVVRGDADELSGILPEKIPLKGPFKVNGALEGEASRPVITGNMEGSAFSFEGSPPFTVSARCSYDFTNQSHPIHVEADWRSIPLDVVRHYVTTLPQTSSRTEGTLHYSGSTEFWAGEGSVITRIIATGARLPVQGEIRSSLNHGILLVEKGDLRLLSTSVTFSGTLRQEDMNLNADLETMRAKDLAFLEPKLASIPGTYRARVKLAGPYNDLRIQGRLQGRSEQTELEAEGSVRPARNSVSLQFQGATTAEDLRAFAPELAAGAIAFQGSVSGNWKNPEWTVHASGSSLRAGEFGIREVIADLNGHGARAQFQVQVPEIHLAAAGTYHLNSGVFAIQGQLDKTSLGEFGAVSGQTSLPVEGNLQADFEASGDLDHWKETAAVVRIGETEFRYRDAIIHLAQTEVRAENGAMNLDVTAQGHNGTLNVRGSVSLLHNYQLDLQTNGTVVAGIIEDLTKDWKGEGEILIDTRIRGTLSHPEFEGTLASNSLELQYLPKNLRMTFERLGISFSPKGVDLDGGGRLNDSPVSWKGTIPLDKIPGNLHVKIAALPLSTFIENPKISGAVDASVDLHGEGLPVAQWHPGALYQLPFHEWTGDVLVTPVDVKLGNNVITTEGPLRLAFQKPVLQLLPVRITSGDALDLQASGSVNLDSGAIDSSLQLKARVDLLSSLEADIQSSGPLVADLQLAGTLEKPEYRGKVTLSDASIRIPNTPLSLEALTVEASFDRNALRVNKIQARSGGGTISGGGEILQGVEGSHVWIQGKNVAMLYPEGLRSQSDFDLKLTGKDRTFLLSGDVNVLRSFYEQQLSLRNPLIKKLLASRQKLAAEKQKESRLRFALHIRTAQDLMLKNNMASLRGSADLKLEGSLHKPVLIGQINVRQGSRIYLMGNQFDVEKATVVFYRSEMIQPDLDFSLVSLIRDSATDTFYEVHLPFTGSASGIEFRNVRSNPSLSEDQIFSLVSQGTTDTGQAGSQREALQRQIVMFFAGQALGSPTAAVAHSVGLSRIQMQQEGLSSVNDPKTRLVLGKDIGAGFTLVYSFALNEPEDQTWIASYRYGRNVLARFIDQSDGTVTASVSHRIQFGKGVSPGLSTMQLRTGAKDPMLSAVHITNTSVIPDKDIQNMLGLSTGDRYDYWRFQEKTELVKKRLQDLGYLAPVVEVREESEENHVSLFVDIRAGSPGAMVFQGSEVGKKQMEYYRSLWRQGISATVVQQLIREDLLRGLRLKGYQQATVTTQTETVADRTEYYFNVAPGALFQSIDLKFQGSGHYDPVSLRKDLQILYGSSSQMFVEAIHDFSSFQERVSALYLERGYVRTSVAAGPVEYMAGKGRVVREIRIEEGPLSKVAAVNVSDGLRFPDSLMSQLVLRPAQAFSPDGLLEDELKIQGFYEAQGYSEVAASGELEFEKDSPDIRVNWSLKTGPQARIASVRITGNTTTREELIRKLAGLREGEVLTTYNRSLARKHLSDLGMFQQVSITSEETENPGEYDVLVSVVETKRYELEYGGRYNTDDNLGAEMRLSDANFMGTAQNLSLYLRYSLDLPIYRLDYILPVTGNLWDRTRFSFFHDVRNEDLTETVSGSDVKIPYVITETAVQFQQDYRLSKKYRFLWGIDGGTNQADFLQAELGVYGSFKGTIARLRGALVVDRRDDPLNATSGHFFSIDGEDAPTVFGTDISYSKSYSQFFFYRKFGPFVSASALRAGVLRIRSSVLTFNEKFRAGGSSTMRGFGQNQVVPELTGVPLDDFVSIFFGGDSVFILNEELRFPIYKWLTGAVFYDGGNVYRLATDFDPMDLRHSAGFGIRAGSGGFLLRLDLGFNLRPQYDESHSVFHFAIGQTF